MQQSPSGWARWQVRLQWWLGWLTFPLVGGICLIASLVMRYQVVGGVRFFRKKVRKLLAEQSGPLIICGNHLTLIDSALIAWAMGGFGRYWPRFGTLPWNVPERTNFSWSRTLRLAAYLLKCLPVIRSGPRSAIRALLLKLCWLLRRGEPVMVFPEGTRSRSGRVLPEECQYGVGRLIRMLGGCQVLCIYLRGLRQQTYGSHPIRGEHFFVDVALLDPQTDKEGLRADRELSRQIVRELARMEEGFFASVQPDWAPINGTAPTPAEKRC